MNHSPITLMQNITFHIKIAVKNLPTCEEGLISVKMLKANIMINAF